MFRGTTLFPLPGQLSGSDKPMAMVTGPSGSDYCREGH